MRNTVTSTYGTGLSFCLLWRMKTAKLINSFSTPEYAISFFSFLSSRSFVEEVCVKAALDSVIQFLRSLGPALLKQTFSFFSEPAPSSCNVAYDCTCLQGK